MNNISFDRAADYYDATRGHPPGVSQTIARSIQTVLPENGRLLEIGIGTGRISRPLLAAGNVVYGLDVSQKMMQRLLEQVPGGSLRPRLAVADAAWIPIAYGTFDVILTVHVFHLIGNWRQALQEIRRVLKSGGCLLAGYDWSDPVSIPSRISDHWHAMIDAFKQQGKLIDERPHNFDVVQEALAASGAQMDEWTAAGWTGEFIPGEYIDRLAQGVYSSSWSIPAQALPEMAGKLRKWAAAEFGSLDQRIEYRRKFMLQRFRWD